jgi:chromosome segregation protein
MQGFKSFAGKVTIPFPGGFNVICGPNGSGKSNVIDALMFVLGTTSAKSIRAQKLQALLFNGARNRKPAEFCEVSIYLDNHDRKIPGFGDEIKITRKMNRSGITVYKIDGKTVTRSRMLDVIANTGLSPDGYNIVMQGDVTRVIEMSSQERRGIIDDISGITEFDDKKEKAYREMEKVENRVRENMIVIAEKQKLVQRLKLEKENAEKYQKINTELRKTRASMLKTRLKHTNEKIKALEKEVGEDAKDLEEFTKNSSEIEKESESIEKSLSRLNNDIIKKSRNYDVMRQLDSVRSEIIRKKDRIDMNDRELVRLESLVAPDEKTSHAAREILAAKISGVQGTLSSLIDIPSRYSTAFEIALGRHAEDVVVSTDEVAVTCVKYLKEKKIGRIRFIPLNKIKQRKMPDYRKENGIIGKAVDLLSFDEHYRPAVEYVLGSTLIVDRIETAKKIHGPRMVTLDGDMKESSGAIIGGFYRKSERGQKRFEEDIRKIEEENENLEEEIEKLEEQLEKLRGLEKVESDDVVRMQQEKDVLEKRKEEFRLKWKNSYEERQILQNKISKIRIEKARQEASLDNIKIEFEEFRDVTEFFSISLDELQERLSGLTGELHRIGPVNLKAIEEYAVISVEYDELKKKLDKLLEEKDAVVKIVQEIEKKRFDKFMETYREISANFTNIYKDMVNGTGSLRLEIENDINSGLIIEANPSGKKVVNLDAMSGGEKTVTSLAFIFATLQHYASPFYVLDEIDAALDKTNTKKISDTIKKYSRSIQFIVITHNDLTIAEGDKVFGVSLDEGVSKVFGIDMPRG